MHNGVEEHSKQRIYAYYTMHRIYSVQRTVQLCFNDRRWGPGKSYANNNFRAFLESMVNNYGEAATLSGIEVSVSKPKREAVSTLHPISVDKSVALMHMWVDLALMSAELSDDVHLFK